MTTELLTTLLLSVASALVLGLFYAAASWFMARVLVMEGRMMKGMLPVLAPWIAVTVRRLYPDPEAFRRAWASYDSRSALMSRLARPPRIEPQGLTIMARAAAGDSDPFDWLCRLAYGTPMQSRHARAQWVQSAHSDFFARFSPQAQALLYNALTRYVAPLPADNPTALFAPGAAILPDILSVDPAQASAHAYLFGGPEALKSALHDLEALMYSA